MKKITFNVSSQKSLDIASFLKDINNISCECYVDFRKNFITIKNVHEDMIDTVTELIGKYYPADVIDSIYIDNVANNQPTYLSQDEDVKENIPISREPQSEDDSLVQKVEYENEHIEGVLNEEITESEAIAPVNEDVQTVIISEDVEFDSVSKNTPSKHRRKKSPYSNLSGEKEAMFKIIGPALEKLDATKPADEQIVDFLKEVDLEISFYTKTAFIAALDIDRITVPNITLELFKRLPTKKEKYIKFALKEIFRRWVSNYPELITKYPKISLTTMIKLFVEKFN